MRKLLIALSIFALLACSYFSLHAYKKYQARTSSEALLKDAKEEADQAVIKRAQEFKTFIDSKKPGVKPFSKDVVSLSGIWNAGKCKFPGAAPNCYEKYISDKFNEHIFTPDDFRDATGRSIEQGIHDLEAIENRLAVSLRKVIEDRTLTAAEKPLEEANFKNAIDSARRGASDGVLKEAGGLVFAEVFTQISTQVIIRLGVSAGIWAAAAGNSWWTLGGSTFIGLIANAIWNHYAHPEQAVETAVIIELDKMASNGSAVIQDELTKKVAARSQLWQTTITEKFQ